MDEARACLKPSAGLVQLLRAFGGHIALCETGHSSTHLLGPVSVVSGIAACPDFRKTQALGNEGPIMRRTIASAVAMFAVSVTAVSWVLLVQAANWLLSN